MGSPARRLPTRSHAAGTNPIQLRRDRRHDRGTDQTLDTKRLTLVTVRLIMNTGAAYDRLHLTGRGALRKGVARPGLGFAACCPARPAEGPEQVHHKLLEDEHELKPALKGRSVAPHFAV